MRKLVVGAFITVISLTSISYAADSPPIANSAAVQEFINAWNAKQTTDQRLANAFTGVIQEKTKIIEMLTKQNEDKDAQIKSLNDQITKLKLSQHQLTGPVTTSKTVPYFNPTIYPHSSLPTSPKK